MELTTTDLEKRRDLRRMKAVALSFLVGAAVVYAVCRLSDEGGWVGYVEAAAEAGMVGALADWFAVTALFRHPLRLPIPHTAIIPRRKDAIGENLGDFVGTNFLNEDAVRTRIRGVGISERVGAWLVHPGNAERVSAETATIVRAVVAVLRDEDVQAVLENALVKRVMDQPWGPPLGKLLQQVLEDGAHRKMVDLVCDRAYDWVRDNEATVQRVVRGGAPTWSPKFVDTFVGNKVYTEVLEFAWAVRSDPAHQMRKAVDTFLTEFADDLCTDPATIERAEAVKRQIIEHPEVQALIGSTWGTAKRMILEASEDPHSELRRRVTVGIRALGQRLVDDREMGAKVDGWLEDAAAYIVTHYRDEITTLITDTVELWDGEETARKVELQVGRDLQFIRINGTVVGAMAGLAIHAVSELLL